MCNDFVFCRLADPGRFSGNFLSGLGVGLSNTLGLMTGRVVEPLSR